LRARQVAVVKKLSKATGSGVNPDFMDATVLASAAEASLAPAQGNVAHVSIAIYTSTYP
jgi:hypothetical protein